MRSLVPVLSAALVVCACSERGVAPERRGATARVALASSSAEAAPPGTFSLEDVATGMSLRVALRGISDVAPVVQPDGAVVYRAAYAGGDVVIVPTADGAKDSVQFPTSPAVAAVEYDLALGAGVAGLRLVADSLELVDAAGAPRLRVGAPFVIGADGLEAPATVTLSGCEADRDPSPPWDRPVTPPGAAVCILRVSWEGQPVAYPAVLDPAWTTAVDMPGSKTAHVAAPWNRGGNYAIAIGGENNGNPVKATFWYRQDGTWATGPNLADEHVRSTATVLADGRILVVGGDHKVSGNRVAPTTTVELLGTAGTFTQVAPLTTARALHAAALLADGKVLVCGGNGASGAVLASCETYDPATNAWAAAPSLGTGQARADFTLTSLDDGRRVVAAGGVQGGTALASVREFDVVSSTWSSATPLSHARAGHGAVALAGGKLLVAGGASSATVELWDGQAWSEWPLAPGGAGVDGTTATLLDSGRVLVVGGGTPSLCVPSTAACAAVGGVTGLNRVDHSATVLGATPGNRKVLVAGGIIGTDANPTVTADLFTDLAPKGVACAAGSECDTGLCVDGVCCDGACGPCGACNQPASLGTCVPRATPKPGTCTTADPICGVGFCDGSSFACRFPGAEKTCAAAHCTSDRTGAVAATACDGTGTCPAEPGASACTTYVCAVAACLTSCAADADCLDAARSCTTASSTIAAGQCVAEKPPVLTVPASPIVAEATKPAGAAVTYSASSVDEVDGAIGPSCVPGPGADFALGTTTVTCTATDHRAFSTSAQFQVRVEDTTPPRFVAPPGDQTQEAAALDVPPFAGATFAWPLPVAEDAVGLAGPVTCDPPSPVSVGVGAHPVTCTARDTTGNVATTTFSLVVTDTTPPALTLPTQPIVAEATSPAGAVATFATSAKDIVDGTVAVSCDWASGATFPLGVTIVHCSATDAHHNTGTGSFTVAVVDTTPPALTLPTQPIVAEATSSAGAVATFATSATDLVDGALAVSCDRASGATFPLGETTVQCSATDAHQNKAAGSFTVTVVDTTPPALTVPTQPIVVAATSSAGSVATFSTSATDLVDGPVAVTCDPLPGATFPLGTTSVGCSATDAHGNTATASFTVEVQVGFGGFLPPISLDGRSAFKLGSTVPVKFVLGGLSAGIKDLKPTLWITQAASQPVGDDLQPASTNVGDAGNVFRYDATLGGYVFNWSTKGLGSSATWSLYVDLGDHAFHKVQISTR